MIDAKGICTECGEPVPDNLLACSACFSVRAHREMLKAQVQYLGSVAKGDVELRVARLHNHEEHVALFGDESTAFCGLDLTGRSVQRRYRVPYTKDNMLHVCKGCSETVARGVREATE
jgi:hypothetical protein